MTEVIDIKETIEQTLMKIPGVTGVGLGKSSPEKIHVYLRSTCPKVTCNIPEEIGGVPVETIVTGRITALQMREPAEVISRTGRLRPYYGGVSVGHKSVSAGTLGVKCYDASTRLPLMLTNNHIASNETSIQVKTASIGDALLQPAPFDGGKYPDDQIGELVGFIDFDTTGNNEVDAAVVSPLNPDDLEDTILEIGKVTKIGEPAIGDTVLKSGRSSGLNSSRVVDVNATIKVDFSRYNNVVFRNQVVITPSMALGGDSGSIVVRESDNKAVGLLFAGSETITLANRMTLVAQALAIDLGSPAPPPSQEKEGGFWGTAVAMGMLPVMFGIAKKQGRRKI